jgi:hypothetical protein
LLTQKVLVTFFIFLCCFSYPSWAQGVQLDEELQGVSNRVMLKIYDDLMAMKTENEWLEAFGSDALTQNPFGIYTIEYSPDEVANGTKPFAFALTIAPADEQIFDDRYEGVFNYSFELLNVKFTGYVTEFAQGTGFVLEDFLQKHGQIILDEQQRRLPLQLALTAMKETFKINEEIELLLVLKNTSNYHIRTKGLNTETVHFWVDGELLVADEGVEAEVGEVVLKSGQSFSRSFRIASNL